MIALKLVGRFSTIKCRFHVYMDNYTCILAHSEINIIVPTGNIVHVREREKVRE